MPYLYGPYMGQAIYGSLSLRSRTTRRYHGLSTKAIFLLSIPWLFPTHASFRVGRSSLSPESSGSPPRTRKRKHKHHTITTSRTSNGDKIRVAESYWEFAGENEIVTINVTYPSGHPHERYLTQQDNTNNDHTGQVSKYGLRQDHDDDDNTSDKNNNDDDNGSIEQIPRNNNGPHENNIVLSFDDDFSREPFLYGHSYQPELGQEQTANRKTHYQPIRIRFITTPLEERRGENEHTDQQIEEFLQTALPEAARTWANHVSVYPVLGTIQVSQDVCYGSFSGVLEPTMEVSDADLVIIVSAYDEMSTPDGETMPVCGPHSLAIGAACALDLLDRPVVGFINLCLKPTSEDDDANEGNNDLHEMVSQAFQKANQIQPQQLQNTTSGVKNNDNNKRVNPTDIILHEVVHVLGFDSYLFKFFRNATTGEPLTPRPFETTNVQCTDGSSYSQHFPSSKVLRMGRSQDGAIYFDVVTHRVAQIVRNHFDCQSLPGARLEHFQSTCVGSHWDERLFLTDLLSPVLAWKNNVLSPLTLALLEDTGWYQVNYKNVSSPSFGLGAGCDFVHGDCIIDGKVPSYAKDYFCNNPIRLREGGSFDMEEDSWSKITCDPSHHYWALCDLWDASTIPEYFLSRFPQGNQVASYFSDDNLLVSFPQADFCPIAHEVVGVDCTARSPIRQTYLGEEAGPDSRCINAFSDISEERRRRYDRPACMVVECDVELQRVVVGSGEFKQICEYDGQVLHIPSTAADFLECPRLSSVCPQLLCPAGCSGRGVCDYNAQPHAQCKCFDPDNTSDGCYENYVSESYEGNLFSDSSINSVLGDAVSGVLSGCPSSIVLCLSLLPVILIWLEF